MSNAVQVFVGFGGSGGKTLAQLAEFIADDASLSDRGDRDFFFMLVDTDSDELEAAEKRIRAGFERVAGASPHIERVLLSEGVGRLQDLVHARLGDIVKTGREGRESAALKEAKRHWYFRGGTPFSARRLPAPLADGAGQCPLAAHFAAWDKVGDMKAALHRILSQMQRRLHELDQNSLVDLVVVGSLAGGTGRGCWQLLSLAARTVFPNCKPHAYLFDASVFDRVARLHPDQAWRLCVNSYTGLSELVGWIRNDVREHGPAERFSMPPLDGLDSGQLCIDTDEIAKAHDNARTGRSPADNFYIITGSSDSHTIQHESEAYKIVAIALLARLAISQVSSSHANGLHYGSCGAAIARVPITDIHGCVTLCAKELALEQLVEVDHAAVVAKVELFGARIGFTVKEAQHGASGAPAETLLGAYKNEMRARMDLGEVQKRLNASAPTKDVRSAIDDAQLITARPTDVQASLAHAFATRFGRTSANLEKTLREVLEEQLRSIFGEGGTASGESGERREIGTAHAFLQALRSKIGDLREHCAKIIEKAKAEDRDFDNDVRDLLEEHEGMRYKVFGERWEEHEREVIESGLRKYSLEANARPLAEQLVWYTDTLMRVVSEYGSALTPFIDAVHRHEGACQTSFQELYARTFMHGNLAAIRTALGSWRSGDSAVVRSLRPTDSIVEIRAFVSGEVLRSGAGGSFRAHRAQMIVEVFDTLLNPEKREALIATASTRDAAQRRYEDRDVPEFLRKLSVPAEAMQRKFSLQRTIEAIERRVRSLLDENIGDSAGCEAVQDSFETIFGIRHARALAPDGRTQEARFAELPTELLMQELGFALASRCDPMFRVDRAMIAQRHVHDCVTVFIPFAGDDAAKTRFEEDARDVATVRYAKTEGESHGARWVRRHPLAKIDQYAVSLGASLPYSIVAHTHFTVPDFEVRSFDGIKSFQTWKTDATVREWLQFCETSDAESVFRERGGNFGVGYIHPDFLKDPWREVRQGGQRVSGLRWAPWQESPAMRRESAAALDAILYAMCGNVPARRSEQLDQAVKVLSAIGSLEPTSGSGYKWTMPLLKRDDKGSWKLTRQCFGKGMGLVQATQGNWKAGQEFPTLQQFIKWIGGPDLANLTTEGREFIAAVQAERDLVHEHVVLKIEDDYGSAKRKNIVYTLGSFLKEYSENHLAKRGEEQRNREQPLVDEMLDRISADGFNWEAPGTGS